MNVGACGGNFSSPNGIIYSNSYPDNYPPNSDCIYRISQPNWTIILVKFISMDIDDWDDYSCEDSRSDSLEIRDGPSKDSRLFDNLCGNKISAPIQTTQNQLFMRSHILKAITV